MNVSATHPLVAIACGGTGGHLFPGLAVAEALLQRGCDILLLISPKEIDQTAARAACGMTVETLPAVGLGRGQVAAFLRGFWRSFRAARALFARRRPEAVLGMGGFTAAPPILAGRTCRAATFVHEANSVPGRANRWLAPWVRQAFVYFPMATGGLHQRRAFVTGMPVRPQVQPMDPPSCRAMLGLDPARPVLLITGGSQGASAVNDLVVQALPVWSSRAAHWQYLHLTGPKDCAATQEHYARLGLRAVVRPFLTEMELALNAANAAVSRAGASSVAELAALRVPSLLIPYPTAADNHQYFNAMALVETGAARMVTQSVATPRIVADLVYDLMENAETADGLRAALARWHRPRAAEEIADRIGTALNWPKAPSETPWAESVDGSRPAALDLPSDER